MAVFALSCVCVFSVMLAASEWLVRVHAQPADAMTKHVALFETTQSPYVAFGDSHVARSFDAQAPVVNLGYPSENIAKIAWKAERYLDRTPSPETVLIQADPHLFAPYRTRTGLEGYSALFNGDASARLLSVSEYYRPQLTALWRAFVTHGGRLESTVETTEQGALLSPGNLAEWGEQKIRKFTADRLELHQPHPGFQQSRAAQQYKSMIAAFLDRGVSVCLVSMPVSPYYKNAVDALPAEQKTGWDEAFAFFEALAQEDRVRYFDHRNLYTNLRLFRDPDHLNKAGAIEYGPVLQDACFGNVKRSDGAQIADLK
ncbi:MAG: hypothetical protein AAGD92_16415 [Pseudomonadota bacterium]